MTRISAISIAVIALSGAALFGHPTPERTAMLDPADPATIPTSDPTAAPWDYATAWDVDRWRLHGCDTDTDCERLSRFMDSICKPDALEDSAACALFDDWYVREPLTKAELAGAAL